MRKTDRSDEVSNSGSLRLYGDRNRELKANLPSIYGALGLARNAGGLAIGTDAVLLSLKKSARLAFITEDTAVGSRDKIIRALEGAGIRYILLPCTMSELAGRLGKTGVVSTAMLTRPGFEKIIFKAMDKAAVQIKHDKTTEVQ